MRHWTQDGAHIVADILCTAGLVGIPFGQGWPSLGLAVTGAVLLGVLRALETRDGFMQAVRAEMNSQATQAELEAVKVRLAELEKPSLSARVGGNRTGQRQPEY